jgi:hypothetical protein
VQGIHGCVAILEREISRKRSRREERKRGAKVKKVQDRRKKGRRRATTKDK